MMQAPRRRRLYLMRHGSVDYFDADGNPVPPHDVPLNAEGVAQARAAGALLRDCGVRPDRVLASGLARTLQTAQHLLDAAGFDLPVETEPELQEIRPGRLADIPPAALREAFLGVFRADAQQESLRFLGGESIGELLDRVLPAFERWLARDDWRCGLMVLHGGVNRALLSTALAGRRAFFGRIEQAPACINVLEIGLADASEIVLRAVNLSPTQWLHEREHLTTMEKLFAQYTRAHA
jgi:broad specificity phosphatase PhoE